VVGRSSVDGLRGWRIDFDPTKGYHVNWWNMTTNPSRRAVWFYGANVIEGGTYQAFMDLLEHFQ
jgi:hypothetical protein